MYGLRQDIVVRANKIFRQYEQVQEVLLYGSRAKGTFKAGSDIDLTLKGDDLNLKLLNKIGLDLDELLLPYIFDISIYNHITNKDLLDHIDRVGLIFYRKNNR
jgi:predicted nucleotidyltransferase